MIVHLTVNLYKMALYIPMHTCTHDLHTGTRGGSRTLPLGGHKLPKLARGEIFWGVTVGVAVFGVPFFTYMAKKYMDKRTTFFSP